MLNYYAALPQGTALSVISRLSVRPSVRPSVACPDCLEIAKPRKTFNLMQTQRWTTWTRVSRVAILRSKGHRSRSLGTKIWNSFSPISSSKLDRFTSNQDHNDQRPIRHIYSNTFHQRKCSVFVIICILFCNYLGGPHVAAATRTCTFLLF